MSAVSNAFAAAEATLHAAFGDPGLLRGSEAVTAVISRGVQIEGDYGQTVRKVDTVAFPVGTVARSGDSLTVGTESWTLDMPLDNDYGRPVFVLLVAAP